LGERVKSARVDAGLSQAQLGAPHFTRAYVSAVELGKIRPAVKSLEFLAGRLGKPLSFFLEDQAEEKRRQEREFEMLRAKELIAKGATAEAVSSLRGLLDDAEDTSERLELRWCTVSSRKRFSNFVKRATPRDTSPLHWKAPERASCGTRCSSCNASR
jgi:transcriptional regulator with XRE-family HTH domain